jgi:hypothetical protein
MPHPRALGGAAGSADCLGAIVARAFIFAIDREPRPFAPGIIMTRLAGLVRMASRKLFIVLIGYRVRIVRNP